MATLMLTSLGSALGGPLGAAIGGLVGQSIDRSLFAGVPRRGPRLGDLSVQTSSYGSMVPRMYGKMRVAGTVVWATDLKEGGELQSGGKGQPDTLAYSYSVSLAVALSSRPLRGIGRIWADGQLLRGAAGDFKVKTGFRFYSGHEDQGADPLIASTEGIDEAPAYRGLALAVFEDLQLASFGNRIPVLTFEVEGDDASPSVGAVLDDVSSGRISVDEPRIIDGYAAYGQSIDEACSPLIESFEVGLFSRGSRLVGSGSLRNAAVAEIELGCSLDAQGAARMERQQQSAEALPDLVSLTFYDASRDYQTGEQSATTGERIRNRWQAELPGVLSAADAKSLAEGKLARSWVERELVKLRLPPTWLSLAPGDLLRLQNVDWQVRRVSIEGLVVTADLVRQAPASSSGAADAGRSIAAADQVAEPTRLALVEIPVSDGSGGLQVHVAASCGQMPWKPVPVRILGAAVDVMVATARKRATLGTVIRVPSACGSSLLDMKSSLEVELAQESDWLESCDDDALVAGMNLAFVGEELLQFGSVTSLGERRFRLSRLLRGRGGSEWAVGLHQAGEQFVLLDPAALARVDLQSAAINTIISALPFGLRDGEEPAATRAVSGEQLRPPAPAHLIVKRVPDGGATATWVRRSRLGWSWTDEVDVPLAEASEHYRVSVSGPMRTIQKMATAAVCQWTADELRSLGQGLVTVAVAQVGDLGASREAVADLLL